MAAVVMTRCVLDQTPNRAPDVLFSTDPLSERDRRRGSLALSLFICRHGCFRLALTGSRFLIVALRHDNPPVCSFSYPTCPAEYAPANVQTLAIRDRLATVNSAICARCRSSLLGRAASRRYFRVCESKRGDGERSRQRVRDQVALLAFGAETRMRSSARGYP
jgi:hypothetical protein